MRTALSQTPPTLVGTIAPFTDSRIGHTRPRPLCTFSTFLRVLSYIVLSYDSNLDI